MVVGLRQQVTEVLLIGEAPNSSGTGGLHESTSSGRRLRSIGASGLRRTNALRRYAGPQGKGSRFPVEEAREGLARIWRRHPKRVAFVYVGKRVAAADGWRGGFLEWGEHRGRRVATIPHPSGIVRWWNDDANVLAAARFFRELRGT